MRNLKLVKLISLLLSLVFVIGMFAACNPTDDPAETTGESNDDQTKEAITVNGDALSQYKIIYGKNATASTKNAAQLLSSKISQLFGYSVSTATDSEGKSANEIIVGESNRTSEDMFKSIRATEYKIFVQDKAIFILAGEDESAIEAAVNAFIGALSELYSDGKAAITTENMSITYSSPEYKVSNLTLNGVNISDYTIVYQAENTLAESLANNIKDAIANVSGYNVTVISDATAYVSGKEILVGSSNRLSEGAPGESIGKTIKTLTDNNLLMYTQGDFFYMGGKSGNKIALIAATNKLVNAINNFEGSGEHAVSFSYSNPLNPQQTQYRIMTYNDGDVNFSGMKLTYRCNMIKEYAPDIIGFQEFQAADLGKYKTQLSAYKFIYFDHEIKTDEHTPANMYGAPIAYLASKFDLVDSGTQWLSETPNLPNSKFSSTAYIRTYVYAVLKDKTTGEEFVIINTHIDYNGTANVQQIEVLLKLTEKFKGKPIVYTGDFNMKFTSNGFKLMESAGFKDSGRYMTKETQNIDYIFFDPTVTEVTYYKCINDHKHSAGMSLAGSDHNPYIIDLVIPS